MDRLTKKVMGKVILPIIPMEIKTKEDLEKYHEVRKQYEAMVIKLAEYEDKEEVGEISEKIKEKVMQEYAEDLYEEFNQVAICEGKITMKDVADILQI